MNIRKLFFLSLTALPFTLPPGECKAVPFPACPLSPSLDALNVPFIPNHGQLNSQVRYYAKTLGGTVFVTHDGKMVYSLPADAPLRGQKGIIPQEPPAPPKQLVITEQLLDARPNTPSPGRATKSRVSIFHGNDPDQWRSGLPTYQDISLGVVYPGIEVRLAAHGGSVEKLFYLAAGANPDDIRININPATAMSVTEGGQLAIRTPSGSVQFSRPVAWQNIDGDRRAVAAAYAINADRGSYGFTLGQYDPNQPLIIDPILQSTYLGGTSWDKGQEIAIGPNGNVYVAGTTLSSDFPKCTGWLFCLNGADPTFAGDYEAFVAEMTPDLTRLIQTTYLGGSCTGQECEILKGMAIDAGGNVYVTGYTSSSDFPKTAGGADSTLSGVDGFVAKFSPDLRTLYQSTFVGGSGNDFPSDIAFSTNMNEILLTGTTWSNDLPACLPSGCFPQARPDSIFAGQTEAFVARFTPDLQTMIGTTYLGGSARDDGASLLVTASGDIYVAGTTSSADFPGLAGGYDTLLQGNEAFLTRFNKYLTGITRSTFCGGSQNDSAGAVAQGVDGSIYIAGFTYSPDLPTCVPGPLACPPRADATLAGQEGFAARFNPDLTTLYSSTYLGGGQDDSITAIAIVPNPDNAWDSLIYVAGDTRSPDFPGAAKGADRVFAGESEGFAAYLDSGLNQIQAASFLGGSGWEFARGLTVSATGDIYVTGETSSGDFPRAERGFAPSLRGLSDAFITRFSSLKGSSFYVIPSAHGKATIVHLE